MSSDEGAQALEPAAGTGSRPGRIASNRVDRAASALVGAAASITVWEIGATVRLASLATDLALRMSADLADRAGQAVGRPAVLDRWMILRIDRGQVTEAWGLFSTGPKP